jgi:hypothetical protein
VPAVPELPLAEQIGLDLLAAELSREDGSTRVVSGDPRRANAALERLPQSGHDEPASRVLWVADAGATDEAPPWRAVAPGGRLAVLAPGQLVGLYDRLRRQPARRTVPIRPPSRAPGFRVELSVGIGSPMCAVWAALAAAARRADRHDLADRFEYRYRRALAPRPDGRLCELVAAVLRRVD